MDYNIEIDNLVEAIISITYVLEGLDKAKAYFYPSYMAKIEKLDVYSTHELYYDFMCRLCYKAYELGEDAVDIIREELNDAKINTYYFNECINDIG